MTQIAQCDWLPERARWSHLARSDNGQWTMEPSCPLGTTRCIPQEKFPREPYNKSFIDQVCAVKMAGYWPHSFFASLWTSTSSWSINMQKKNLANIQPSWPHTWSITHTTSGYIENERSWTTCQLLVTTWWWPLFWYQTSFTNHSEVLWTISASG